MPKSTQLDQLSPVFIVGVPRSGTTLLSAMLSSHPRIAIAPETHFIAHDYRTQSAANLDDDRVFSDVWEHFVEGRWFRHLGIDGSAVYERIRHQRPRTFGLLFTAVLEAYAKSVNKPRWGEKTPGHYLHVDTILDWFPNARVIFVFRDPRAVCASLLKAPFGNRYVSFHCDRWNDAIKSLNKIQTDNRLMSCRYEDLVSQPEQTLRGICTHLEENFDPQMVDRTDCSMPNLRTGWGEAHLTKAISHSVSTDNIDKWKQQLNPTQISMIETITDAGMRQLGYRPVQSKRLAATSGRVAIDRLVCRICLGIGTRLRGLTS